MRERHYQAQLIKKLRVMFPDAIVLKNDSSYIQGIPDISIFFGDKWAMLEVKLTEDSIEQPNQAHYVDRLNGMSFAAFIYPENEERVLNDLQSALGLDREARIS